MVEKKKSIKRPVTVLGAKPKDIEGYIKFVEENDIIDLTIEEHGVEVNIKRGEVISPAVSVRPQVGQPPLEVSEKEFANIEEEIKEENVEKEVESKEDDKYHKILSPIVGTFYRAPSPTSPPFVEVGDSVKSGQTLCIVEAMKVMNKINSDINGKIVKIIPENGTPVKKDDVLFLIDPS